MFLIPRVAIAIMLLLACPSAPGATETPRPLPGTSKSSAAPAGGIETRHVGEGIVQTDRTGKGAVLCAWEMLVSAAAAARECSTAADHDFDGELYGAIARVDAFILANSKRPITRSALDGSRAQFVHQVRTTGALCGNGALQMYRRLRADGSLRLRSWIDDLLSIPREPVMDPCL